MGQRLECNLKYYNLRIEGGDDVDEHLVLILEILGIITALGSAGAVIWKVVNPFKKANDKIESHERRLNDNDETLREVKEMQKMQMKAQLVLLDHEITGNGIEKMKAAKAEMQNFLIENVK